MKKSVDIKQMTWFGGGGGGGGGGGACCWVDTTYAALQALASAGGLIEGTFYHITNVNADWEVVVLAESASAVSTQGQGIFQNSLYVEAYYQLSTNSILKVYDPLYNNEIEGETNVLGFVWNSAAWQNNKVLAGSTLTLSGFTATEFKGNILSGQSSLDLTGSTFNQVVNNKFEAGCIMSLTNCVNTVFTDNLFNTAVLTFDGSTIGSIVENNITTSVIVGDEFTSIVYFDLNVFISNDITLGINNVDFTDATVTNFSGNVITGNSLVDLTNSQIGAFVNNSISISSVNFLNATCSQFVNNVIGQNSSLDAENTVMSNFLSNILLSFSTITMNDLTGVVDEFNYNEFLGGSLLYNDSELLTFNLNSLKYGSYIDNQGGIAVITTIFNNNLSNGSSIVVDGCVCNSIGNNVISEISTIDFTDATIDTFNYNVLAQGAIVNATEVDWAEVYNNEFISLTADLNNSVVGSKMNNNSFKSAVVSWTYSNVLTFSHNNICTGHLVVLDSILDTFINNAATGNGETYDASLIYLESVEIGGFYDNYVSSGSSLNITDSVVNDFAYNNISQYSYLFIQQCQNVYLLLNSLSSYSGMNIYSLSGGASIEQNKVELNSQLTFTGSNNNVNLISNIVSQNSIFSDLGIGEITCPNISNNRLGPYGNMYLHECTSAGIFGNVVDIGQIFYANATSVSTLQGNILTRGFLYIGNTTNAFSTEVGLVRGNEMGGGFVGGYGNLSLTEDVICGNVYGNTIMGASTIELNGTTACPFGIGYNNLDSSGFMQIQDSYVPYLNGNSLIQGSIMSFTNSIINSYGITICVLSSQVNFSSINSNYDEFFQNVFVGGNLTFSNFNMSAGFYSNTFQFVTFSSVGAGSKLAGYLNNNEFWQSTFNWDEGVSCLYFSYNTVRNSTISFEEFSGVGNIDFVNDNTITNSTVYFQCPTNVGYMNDSRIDSMDELYLLSDGGLDKCAMIGSPNLTQVNTQHTRESMDVLNHTSTFSIYYDLSAGGYNAVLEKLKFDVDRAAYVGVYYLINGAVNSQISWLEDPPTLFNYRLYPVGCGITCDTGTNVIINNLFGAVFLDADMSFIEFRDDFINGSGDQYQTDIASY